MSFNKKIKIFFILHVQNLENIYDTLPLDAPVFPEPLVDVPVLQELPVAIIAPAVEDPTGKQLKKNLI